MRTNFSITIVFAGVLLTCCGSSIPAEENRERDLKKQLHERRVAYRDELQKVFDVLQRRYIDGVDAIGCASKVRFALLEADLAIESASDLRIRKLKDYVDQLKQIEDYHHVRLKIGLSRMEDVCISTADRIQGEIMLLEEQERQQRH